MRQYLNTTQSLKEKVVHSMIVAVVLLGLVYCVILLSLVFSVIERKEVLATTKDMSSTLSSVEQSYAHEVAAITDDVLLARGYSKVDGATLTVRKDPIASYTVLYDR